ncbi:MAG: hypothetical protein HY901_07905 [Deltaproteobacteria bacterium]|nr:hypothetical protein [Deltaproteobacteria bacterium]
MAEAEYLGLTLENPYQNQPGKPLALAVTTQFAKPHGAGHGEQFLLFADHMLRMMWDALAYWTPERIEHSALARAGEAAEPSLLSREASLFAAQYFKKWLPALHEWARHDHSVRASGQYERALFVRDLLQEATQALERRSTALEGRALDLRLRFDLRHIQALLAREDLAAALISAVDQAALAADKARFDAVREELEKAAARLEPRLGRLEDAIEFLWERSVKQWGREELLAGGPVRKTVGALAVGLRSALMSAVFKKLLGP